MLTQKQTSWHQPGFICKYKKKKKKALNLNLEGTDVFQQAQV